MKKKFKRFGRSSVSLLLSLLMIVSCVIVGNVGTIEAVAENFNSGATGSGNYIYYFSETDQTVTAHFWHNSDSNNPMTDWNNLTPVSPLSENNHVFKFEIPKWSGNNQVANMVIFNKVPDSGKQITSYNRIWFNNSWNDVTPFLSSTWYLEGRIGVKDSNGNTVYAGNDGNDYATYSLKLPFTKIGDVYKLQTYCTLSELSNNANDNYFRFFNTSLGTYCPSGNINLGSNNNQTEYTINSGTNFNFKFNESSSTNTQLVTLCIKSGENGQWKFYYETAPTTGTIHVKAKYGSAAAVADSTNAYFTDGTNLTDKTNAALNTAHGITAYSPVGEYSFKSWEVENSQGSVDSPTLVTANFTPKVDGATVTAIYKKNFDFDTNVTTNGESSAAGGTVALSQNSGSETTITVTKNPNYSINKVSYTYYTGTNDTTGFETVEGVVDNGNGKYTITPLDAATSQKNKDIIINVDFGPLKKYQITAYIDDSNRVTKRKTFAQAYHASISAGGNTVTSTTNGMIQMEVNEGTPVTLTLYDDNATTGSKDDFIIDKWVLSETVSGVTTTCTERNPGSFSITFTPTCSIDAVGFFKEDEGVELSSARYLMFTDVDGWENWINGQNTNKLKYVPVKQTVSGQYIATVGSSEFGSQSASTIHYYFVLSSAQDSSGLYHHNGKPQMESLNTAYITVEQQEKDGHGFGRLSCIKGGVTEIKFYLSSIDAACKYSLYPVVSNTDEPAANQATIIAKDGTIRSSYKKYAGMADTQITSYTYNNGTVNRSGDKLNDTPINTTAYNNYAETVNVPQGSTITFTTTIDSTYRNDYYVRAFNINGDTYFPTNNNLVNGIASNGAYTCSYTIPEGVSKVEITPIYYYQSTDNTVTFYVEDFAGDVKTQWSNTNGTPVLAAYAWYNTDQSKDLLDPGDVNKPALGGYPGQPMVYENGRYEMQVPKYVNYNSVIGVTLNNYVWDEVHGQMLGAYNDGQRESVNCQTYDYDDFVELAKRTNNIIFKFKHETKKNPGSDRYHGNEPGATLTEADYADTNGNGYEVYTDYYGNVIDLLNNKHKDNPNWNETYATVSDVQGVNHYTIVSDGYKDMYLGHFAVMWNIYYVDKTNNTSDRVAQLPSSALFYDPMADNSGVDFDGQKHISNNTAPESFITALDNSTRRGNWSGLDSKSVGDYWTTYKDLYNQVIASPAPAIITYETAIRATDVNENGHPKDPALRSDGRWYYSEDTKREITTANIIIEYKANSNAPYTVDVYSSNTNVGTVTNAKPHFTKVNNTNTTNNSISENEVEVNSSWNLGFSTDRVTEGNAVTGTTNVPKQNYVFEGWYVKSGDTYSPINKVTELDKVSGEYAQLGAVTLVARYVPTTDLVITHELYKDAVNASGAHDGTGTLGVSATVNGTSYTADANGYVAIPSSVFTNNETLTVTLTVTPDANCTFVDNYLMTNGESGSETYTKYNASGTITGPSEISWGAPTSNTESGVTTITWTVPAANLLDNGSFKSSTLKFYSDLDDTRVSIVFKYYDRDDSAAAHGKPEDIDSKPTELTVKVAPFENGDNLSAIIATAMTNGKVSASNITSAIDDYYFWASQSDAVAGMQLLVNHHTSNQSYYSGADLVYHTDRYGYTHDEQKYTPDEIYDEKTSTLDNTAINANKEEKWVTYYNENGTQLGDDAAAAANPTAIKKIVVWGFNTPKDYKVTFTMPTVTELINDYIYVSDDDDDVTGNEYDGFKPTGAPDTLPDCFTKNNKSVYFKFYGYDASRKSGTLTDVAGVTGLEPIKAKYNERIGESFEGVNGVEGVNALSTYFKKVYDVEGTNKDDSAIASGKLPGSGTSNSLGGINAPETIKSDDNEGTLRTFKFDGWYVKENNSYTKISSDAHYNNRVTCNLDLIAGYVEVADENVVPQVDKGISLSKNQETFIQDNDGTPTQYVRYQTIVNAYGFEETYGTGSTVDDDRSKLKKALIAYVMTPSSVTVNLGGNTSTITGLEYEESDIEAALIKAFEDNSSISGLISPTTQNSNAPYAGRIKVHGSYKDGDTTIERDIYCNLVYFVYDIVPTPDTGLSGTTEAGKIYLTNKNRAQISLILNVQDDLVKNGITNFGSYVVYSYEDQDSTTYYRSDNAVVFETPTT